MRRLGSRDVVLVVLTSALAAGACSSSGARRPADGGAQPPPAPPADAEAAALGPVPDAALDAPPREALGLERVDDETIARMRALPPLPGAPSAALPPAAAAALEAAMSDPDGMDAATTILDAVAAIEAAPASAPARFVLACGLAQIGAHDEAAAVLRSLRDAGCPACLDALLNAAVAAESDPCSFDARAREVAAGLSPSPVRSATETILASINSGDAAAATPFLDARRPVVMTSECSVCDEASVSTSRKSRAKMIAFIRDAERRLEEGPTSYYRPKLLFCDARCCQGPTGGLSHTSVFVTAVCFHPGQRPTLARIDAIDGG